MRGENSEAPTATNNQGFDLSATLSESTDMKIIANKELAFHSTVFTPVVHSNQIWLTATELAKALEYKKADAVTQIYARNSDEFSACMSTTLKLRVVRKTGDVDMMVRCFSLRGAHLVAMFADTPVAKEFRRWALDVMDRDAAKSPIKRRADYNYPIESADPHDRIFGNDWMSPKTILDERNRAPELELIEQLEKDGYDLTGVKVRIHAMYGIAKQVMHLQETFGWCAKEMKNVADTLKNNSTERGMNVSFTGNNKGSAIGGYTKRSLR
ncbi:TPA: Bro-N domain-containing protein [Yersinia enterocolitica]|uniref:BRO-N domain-containing protein n=1 Tax=Yersinia enterocolitica TaxID=630 RepID=UPI00313F0740